MFLIKQDSKVTAEEIMSVSNHMTDSCPDIEPQTISHYLAQFEADQSALDNTIDGFLTVSETVRMILFSRLCAVVWCDDTGAEEQECIEAISARWNIPRWFDAGIKKCFQWECADLVTEDRILTFGPSGSSADIPLDGYRGKIAVVNINNTIILLCIDSADLSLRGEARHRYSVCVLDEKDEIDFHNTMFWFIPAHVRACMDKKKDSVSRELFIQLHGHLTVSTCKSAETIVRISHIQNKILFNHAASGIRIMLGGREADAGNNQCFFDGEIIAVEGQSGTFVLNQLSDTEGSVCRKREETLYLKKYCTSFDEKSVCLIRTAHHSGGLAAVLYGYEGSVYCNGALCGRTFHFKSGSRIVIGPLIVCAEFTNGVLSVKVKKVEIDSVQFSNMSVAIKRQKRNLLPQNELLHNVDFTLRAGFLHAILGPAGSGKSTILNTLLGRLHPVRGAITVNGFNMPHGLESLKEFIGFVPQDDIMLPALTVYENLACRLRIARPHGISERERYDQIIRVVKDVGLEEKIYSRTGSVEQRILSGGERRRLSIALELLADPDVLLLDEPTTGLSSQDAESIVILLQSLAKSGKIVLMIIHQPSSVIYRMIDTVIILNKKGHFAYSGGNMEALRLFEQALPGHSDRTYSECSACRTVNPDILMKALKAESSVYWDIVSVLAGKITSAVKETFHTEHKAPLPKPHTFSFFMRVLQTAYQFRRLFLCKLRDRANILVTFLAAPALGIVSSFLFRISPSQEYSFAQNTQYPVFLFITCIAALFFGVVNSIGEFINDRLMLRRESLVNFSVFGYCMSKFTVLIIFGLLQSVLFVIPSNIILGCTSIIQINILLMFIIIGSGVSLGLFFSSILPSLPAAYNTLPLIFVALILLSGVQPQFSEMNKRIFLWRSSETTAVPPPADLALSRWAYELLITGNAALHPYKMLDHYEAKERKKILRTLKKQPDASVEEKYRALDMVNAYYYGRRILLKDTYNQVIANIARLPSSKFLSVYNYHSKSECLTFTYVNDILILLMYIASLFFGGYIIVKKKLLL